MNGLHNKTELPKLGRAISFHMHVPKSYLRDVVLTASYNVNHMPSAVLGGQIPHRVLFPGHTLYTLGPRVFGCTCYVHAINLGVTSSIRLWLNVFFLGTLELRKGYNRYSPVLRRTFVCVGVTFNESLP